MFTSRTNWPLEQNDFAKALEHHRRIGTALIDLTNSNPTTCGFQYPEKQILEALADSRALQYQPESKGLAVARCAIARYYRGRNGFIAECGRAGSDEIDLDRLILTSGTSEAYTYIFRLLCEAGDEVLVPEPGYPLFEFLAELCDVKLIAYPLAYDGSWRIDTEALQAAIGSRSKAIIVVHPNNPTGLFVKKAEADRIAGLCAAHDMAIVADEVFLDYADGAAEAPTFAFESRALTFTLSGISKISALPQMKLAWIAASGPNKLVACAVERLDVIADTYLSPSTPAQLASAKFLELRHDMQDQLRRRIGANLAHLDCAFTPGGAVTRSHREGGWYALLRVPSYESDDRLAVRLLESCSVAVHPGSFFNFAQDGYLVLSLITPESEFQEGVARIRQFFMS